MDNTYKNAVKLLVAVDCIIFGFDNEELKLLLVKRGLEPEKGSWSLMGGFLKDEETSEQAAERVLYQLTGLRNVFMEQVQGFTHPQRDPVERTISIAYYALINIEDHNRELIRKYSAKWFGFGNTPKLIFDHPIMVKAAIHKLRLKTAMQPVGFELLPEKFTMRQLQKLYEAIFGEEYDKRNFNKKINQLNILEKLDEKDMSSSKKGSFLYRFDATNHNSEVNNNSYSFKI